MSEQGLSGGEAAKKQISYCIDFMINRDMPDDNNPFRLAAQAYMAGDDPKDTFKYGEVPSATRDQGFSAIYAEAVVTDTWVEAETNCQSMHEAIIRRLGTFGLRVIDIDYPEGDVYLVDGQGDEVGIYSGTSMVGGDLVSSANPNEVTHWGVNRFPKVDLT